MALEELHWNGLRIIYQKDIIASDTTMKYQRKEK